MTASDIIMFLLPMICGFIIHAWCLDIVRHNIGKNIFGRRMVMLSARRQAKHFTLSCYACGIFVPLCMRLCGDLATPEKEAFWIPSILTLLYTFLMLFIMDHDWNIVSWMAENWYLGMPLRNALDKVAVWRLDKHCAPYLEDNYKNVPVFDKDGQVIPVLDGCITLECWIEFIVMNLIMDIAFMGLFALADLTNF